MGFKFRMKLTNRINSRNCPLSMVSLDTQRWKMWLRKL